MPSWVAADTTAARDELAKKTDHDDEPLLGPRGLLRVLEEGVLPRGDSARRDPR